MHGDTLGLAIKHMGKSPEIPKLALSVQVTERDDGSLHRTV